MLATCTRAIVSRSTPQTELLDVYAAEANAHAEEQPVIPAPEVDATILGLRESAFTWTSDNDGTMTPGTPGSSRRNFTLRIDGELTFKTGVINLIVGPTGSGKTSLLMALLGEMHYLPSGPESYAQLPRDGGVAYAAQESWVQNETIRVCLPCPMHIS